MAETKPPVAIIMGSQSDWATMRHAAETLDALAIPYDARIISAHRTPERMVAFAKGAKATGFKVVIAGAGGAAHLPGMTASLTPLPVFGVPVESKALSGQDSLLSIVQMPAGIPVGTLAIGQYLLTSRTGYYWRALRDNEEAAEALGVNARAYKLRCFMLSAGVSALCGAFYANYVAFVDPRSVLGIDLSIQMLVYSIIGGMALLWGPLLGAVLLVPFSVVLRNISAIQGSEIIAYAVLLVVLALVLPQGIAGWLVARWRRRGSVRPEGFASAAASERSA